MKYPTKDSIQVCIDEAGRGCLMGDVCAAAVIMPFEYDDDDKMVKMIKDSKKLSEKRREVLADYIKTKAIAYGIGLASAEEIDKMNILKATHLAMHRAIDKITVNYDMLLIDGSNFNPYINKNNVDDDDIWVNYECVVNGDNEYLGIAAASILAKTYRDGLIKEMCAKDMTLDEKYGFVKNKGYGTRKHIEGIKRFGVLDIHRKTFGPCRI
jgi:ribonuclease HII